VNTDRHKEIPSAESLACTPCLYALPVPFS
jgi:hypothetical protein